MRTPSAVTLARYLAVPRLVDCSSRLMPFSSMRLSANSVPKKFSRPKVPLLLIQLKKPVTKKLAPAATWLWKVIVEPLQIVPKTSVAVMVHIAAVRFWTMRR